MIRPRLFTSKRVLLSGVAALLLATTACGPELSPLSKLSSLRILGLKKSAPYARPGEEVKLSLLWEDVAGKKPRDVQRFIGFWCVNPPGDLFAQCLSGTPSIVPTVAFNEDELTIKIPEGAIKPNVDVKAPPYGIAYVFYAVCAGTFGGAPTGGGGAGGAGGGAVGGSTSTGSTSNGAAMTGGGLPTCFTKDGQPATADDYVVGYSSIFIYDDFRNENPKITGFEVNRKDVTVDCIGDACVGKPFAEPELEGCVPGVACIEACADDAGPSCPKIEIRPKLDRSIAEEDSISKAAYGENYTEGVWVNYFVDRGSLASEVRLVNDATTGWNSTYESKFLAPKKKGPLRIWATVRDNRGGIEWVRIPAYVK